MEKKQLEYFIDVIKESDSLSNGFSGLSLIEQLNKYSSATILEIKENQLQLSKEDYQFYLDYVINSIESQDYDPNLHLDEVNSYLLKYNVKLDDISGLKISNQEFQELLETDYREFRRNSLKRDEAYHCQITFLNYFKTLFVNNILDYCNSSSKYLRNTKRTFNSEIFRGKNEQIWFIDTLKATAFLDNNKKAKRGFQAFAKALLDNTYCKKYIFKSGLKQIDYCQYLNKEFNAEIKSPKHMSSGTLHIDIVVKLIEEYIKKLPSQ